ncbi:acylneuraminate cytidylyltransferase family protein [Paenibacillus sp.]|uniref:acylneuraminate cytidylyltransferase family protein n=1 Tax=Paenibacillus sp. TaxID=58172 RepID=UPI002D6461AF|nr:acylneuraminate cytidylyltransferase family protein [Paenibacillus sp.]HZG87395.1 acylneuraminate cytidylyltransferase family protein [Paenibacillus sp.]
MIDGKTILAVVPARGGSKGVPRKNIRPLAGKPLIAWTIGEAKASKYIDRVIVSSEDDEIIETARQFGGDVPYVRPESLAQDDTPGIDPILHAMEMVPGYDYVMLLQPTSPLRTAGDIDGCIELCHSQRAKACVTVTEPEKSPYWMYTVDGENKMQSLLNVDVIPNRQQLPKVYALNGAVYIAESEWLRERKAFITSETVAYPMPKERSFDIDNEIDFRLCEWMITQRT